LLETIEDECEDDDEDDSSNQGRLAMDKLWYYTQGASQEKKGPVPEAEIRSLIAGGQIHVTDLLWSDGMANWAPLSALPRLHCPLPPPPLPKSFFISLPFPRA
jgi:hypothetical protein